MLTIFTPTYNRAYILSELYNSLQNQTSKDFEWLIIDDGSTDETESLVNIFIKSSDLNIRYYKKHNQGKHIAINYGVSRALGELFFIVDSDDVLSDNAIEVLLEKYNKIKYDSKCCGIAIGCHSIKNRRIIYSKNLPHNDIFLDHNELVYKIGIKGDFATAFKTSVQKEYPYPYFEGETFFRESYVYRQIGKKYKTLYIDDPIYFADYLEDGLTSKSWKLLKSSPYGASLFFKELSNEDIPLKDKFIALNAYWDFQLNDIKTSFIDKFKGVNFLLSVIILINRKLKLLKI